MRIVLLIVGIYQAANGIVMLAMPEAWYLNVPGVTQTGPANLHFIRDIGLAFLAAGIAVSLAAREGAGAMVLVPAAIFLGGHAGLHLVDIFGHGAFPATWVRDVLLIVVPGVIPPYALWRGHGRAVTRRV